MSDKIIRRSDITREKTSFAGECWQFIVDNIVWLDLSYIILILMKPVLVYFLMLPILALNIAVYFCMPKSGWLLHGPKLKSKKGLLAKINPVQEKGLVYLGDNKIDGRSLWLSEEELLRHLLLLGETGAGKTECIIGYLEQFMALGSGFIFVDGKGGLKTYAKIYTAAKTHGREEDLLVLNFKKKQDGITGRISNTLNFFESGSSDSLMEILLGMMGDAKRDDPMWRGRAESFGRCFLRAMCELRDLGKITLNAELISQKLPLNEVEDLAENADVSDEARDELRIYLQSLPGYSVYKQSDEDDKAGRDALKTASEQHGYLIMQFTKVLTLLSKTYSEVITSDVSEVDFYDVIKNRRCVYIILPLLEMSQDSISSIGKLLVSAIRDALAPLLGDGRIAGSRSALLEHNKFNADIPFALVLDEYGFYPVDGFAQIAAQARDLGISTMFAAQEFDAIAKNCPNEAGAILANTNVKMVMAGCSRQTIELVNDYAGTEYIYAESSLKRNDYSSALNYAERGNAMLQNVTKVDADDVAAQRPGEAFVIHKRNVWQIDTYYSNIQVADVIRFNTFVTTKVVEQKNSSDGEPFTYDDEELSMGKPM